MRNRFLIVLFAFILLLSNLANANDNDFFKSMVNSVGLSIMMTFADEDEAENFARYTGQIIKYRKKIEAEQDSYNDAAFEELMAYLTGKSEGSYMPNWEKISNRSAIKLKNKAYYKLMDMVVENENNIESSEANNIDELFSTEDGS